MRKLDLDMPIRLGTTGGVPLSASSAAIRTESGLLINRLLVLPDLVDSVDMGNKRNPEPPNTGLLTPDQRVIFDEMLEYLTKNERGLSSYVVKGYAGTGKTFLMSMFVESLLCTNNWNIAMTAPTHKAVKVMNEMSSYASPKLNYTTIHSLLGLREKIDFKGRQTFVQLKQEDCKVHEYRLVIVDESSMLADELFDLLYEYEGQVKIIFVGDPCQIPPVGMEDSIPFNDAVYSRNKMAAGELTHVMRQAAENPIIATTMKIRKALGREDVLPVRRSAFDDSSMEGLYFLTSSDRTSFMELLRVYFNSPNFEENSDFVKVIAWTNKTVKTFNELIRKMIYGKDVPKYCIGEKLIANRPITTMDGEPLFTNNEEFEIESYEIVEATYKGLDFKFYDAKVVQKNQAFSKRQEIRLVHEDSDQTYRDFLDSLIHAAKSAKQGSYEAIDAWRQYYRVQEIFADVNYNYAITAHKSQGSTYQNVFVMEGDIDFNRRIVERNRIKYTAFTRPSKKLFICN